MTDSQVKTLYIKKKFPLNTLPFAFIPLGIVCAVRPMSLYHLTPKTLCPFPSRHPFFFSQLSLRDLQYRSRKKTQ